MSICPKGCDAPVYTYSWRMTEGSALLLDSEKMAVGTCHPNLVGRILGIEKGSEEVRGPYVERYPEWIRRGERSLCGEVSRRIRRGKRALCGEVSRMDQKR